MYVWTPAPDVTARWRNRMLYAGVDTVFCGNLGLVEISITDPARDTYWGLMTYALSIPEPY